MKHIKDVQRMGHKKQNKTRDILVTFTNKRSRDDLYQNRKMLRDRTDAVYLNEDLTQLRSQLFYQGRRLRRQGRIYGVWTQQGNILIKVHEQSQPKAVSNYKQIISLTEEQSSIDQTITTYDQEAASTDLEDSDVDNPHYKDM